MRLCLWDNYLHNKALKGVTPQILPLNWEFSEWRALWRLCQKDRRATVHETLDPQVSRELATKCQSLSANGLANFTPTSGVVFEVSGSASRVRSSFRLRVEWLMSCTQFALNGKNIKKYCIASTSFVLIYFQLNFMQHRVITFNTHTNYKPNSHWEYLVQVVRCWQGTYRERTADNNYYSK